MLKASYTVVGIETRGTQSDLIDDSFDEIRAWTRYWQEHAVRQFYETW
jgi:hypothetical protein